MRTLPANVHETLVLTEHGAFWRPSLLGMLGHGYLNAKGVNIPVAVSVFPDEFYLPPRSWAEKGKLVHFDGVARRSFCRLGTAEDLY